FFMNCRRVSQFCPASWGFMALSNRIAPCLQSANSTHVIRSTEKLQTSTSKLIARQSALEPGAWIFSGCWSLEFGTLSGDRSFNLSVRLVRRHEQFVFIFEAERLEIDEQAMLVGHRDVDFGNLRRNFQRRLAHLKKRHLHGRAEVF